MAAFVGFDRSRYPGAGELQWLFDNTNLYWCGYYLAPAPNHSDTSWMGARADLVAGGWGLLPIYVGRQIPGASGLTGEQGSLDGAQAAQLATDEGFAAGTYLYLDIEDPSTPSAAARDYLAAWIGAVRNGSYAPGIYCSHLIAAELASWIDATGLAPDVRFWPWKVPTTATHPYQGDVADLPSPDPSGSGYAGATAWQYEQNIRLTLPGAPVSPLVVDLSTATLADPGAAPAPLLPERRAAGKRPKAREAAPQGARRSGKKAPTARKAAKRRR